jgi:hypothetical protein
MIKCYILDQQRRHHVLCTRLVTLQHIGRIPALWLVMVHLCFADQSVNQAWFTNLSWEQRNSNTCRGLKLLKRNTRGLLLWLCHTLRQRRGKPDTYICTLYYIIPENEMHCIIRLTIFFTNNTITWHEFLRCRWHHSDSSSVKDYKMIKFMRITCPWLCYPCQNSE